MARENQGLQIALIIFVFLTLILGVTTFLFQRQATEKAAEAAKMQQEATEAGNTADKIQQDFNTVKGYGGFAASEGIDAIGEQFRAHMDQYAANLPEQERSYQAALKDLAATVQAKNESLASAEDAGKLLQERIQQLEQSKAPLVAQEKQRADNAAAQLAKATKDYNDARTTLTDQGQKQLIGFKQRVGEQDQQRSALEAEIAQHQTRIDELRGQLKTANIRIEDILAPTFEQADGKIRWVNQRNQTVWISLGSADALQKLTSFSVYPADTNDVTKVGKKGSIEVTQVLEDHLAEARIVEDEPGNPIMPGDVVHTPVWAPGEREHFALTDGMDLDGDGKSDLETVIRIITLNGGVVDTYITDEGELHGKFTNNTRYLVLGDAPDETSAEGRLKARNEFLTDARGRAITEIQLKDLLNKMGWKNQAPVVHFGRGANPNDFRVRPPEGGLKESTGTVSPLFQPRQPPRGSRGSAY
ncbi:MAG TPA: hypothetical protein VMY37_09055 [Thermoguttaceae bacterium]|nr:hypothetical protein [Thermoguttaceae bacterium]